MRAILDRVLSSTDIQTTPSRGPLPLDDALKLLRSSRRRYAVDVLPLDDEIDIGELATEIAEIEVGGNPTSKERKRVYVSLYQTHIPKLTKSGVLEAIDHNTYRAGPAFEQVAGILECVRERAEEARK